MEAGKTLQLPRLYGEEVGRSDRLPMRAQDLGTYGAFGTLGCRFDAVVPENVGDRGPCDAVAELAQLALDPLVSPGPVFNDHQDYESPDLLHHSRSTRFPHTASVGLTCDELVVPSQYGVRRDDGTDLDELGFPESFAEYGQLPVLIVSKPWPLRPELLAEGLVLSLEVVDDPLLFGADIAGHNNTQQLPRMERWDLIRTD